ncbi:beta-glucosidase like protein [Zymoseptoria brevis]|uniref:beta-glucosidase n=1 Tax=Zymoseptoria brevis TaxID=1047168 RepID=A0A0F4GIS7_9PEZI|nr:beta-glucosidase like protein [Zymoseptoria brevis]
MVSTRWLLATFACRLLTTTAQSEETQRLADVLFAIGLVPDEALATAAAGLLVSGANATSGGLQQALSAPGIDERKRTQAELFYSYGGSPPVYPSPKGGGVGDWAEAYGKAQALVAQMTNEEKNNVTTPVLSTRGCSGFTGTVERLGFPGICLNDGPAGVKGPVAENDTRANGFPAQLSVGATWNRGLAYWRGQQMGKEFKAKGVDVALAPVLGPLGRIATGGRNWEGFSNDPFLAGALVEPTIKGLQESVVACAKHFIGNEQETQRNPFLVGYLDDGNYTLNASVSANIDDSTMHELYLWPWYDAVRAGVGSVMCSYQRVNNSYACQNSAALNGLLKGELGFQGFVVSDWFAQHAGIATAETMEMAMPDPRYWGNGTLSTAVSNGSLEASRLDDMATRILASWYRYSTTELVGFENHYDEDVRQPESAAAAFQVAVEGHVLVKNLNNALPLSKPTVMSVFGWDAVAGSTADPTQSLGGVGLANTQVFTSGKNFSAVTYLELVAATAPLGTTIPDIALNGTVIAGGGSGSCLPATASGPYEALLRQALSDGTKVYNDTRVTDSPVVEDGSGVCLVFINAQAAEAAERTTLADEFSDNYVDAVASQCANTVVIIHNAGIRLVDRFFDHENITAILYGHTPGPASGDALVELLYGRQSPSGRLPYTVAHDEADYGSLLRPDLPTEQDPQYAQSNFTEGVFIDYRRFIKEGITPRFEFGYGLTYSNFSYSNFSVSKVPNARFDLAPPGSKSSAKAPEGGLASLYDVLATACVTVTNTGKAAAAEVAQLYVNIPSSGVERALRGFDKKLLQPGESTEYTFDLKRRDLSLWSTEKQDWMLQDGQYEIVVGKSVLNVQGTAVFSV